MSTYKNLISLGAAAVFALGLSACSSSSDNPPPVGKNLEGQYIPSGTTLSGLDADDTSISLANEETKDLPGNLGSVQCVSDDGCSATLASGTLTIDGDVKIVSVGSGLDSATATAIGKVAKATKPTSPAPTDQQQSATAAAASATAAGTSATAADTAATAAETAATGRVATQTAPSSAESAMAARTAATAAGTEKTKADAAAAAAAAPRTPETRRRPNSMPRPRQQRRRAPRRRPGPSRPRRSASRERGARQRHFLQRGRHVRRHDGRRAHGDRQ